MSKNSEGLINKEVLEETEKNNENNNECIKTENKELEMPCTEEIHEEKYDSLTDEKITESTTSKHSILLMILIIFCIFILIATFSTVFAFLNIGSTKLISGIYINNINVSGLTCKEATEKISNKLSEELNAPLTLIYQDYSTTLVPSKEIDANYDISSAIEQAYLIGRSDNIFKNNFEIFFTYLTNKKIDLKLQYNQEKLNYIVKNVGLEIPGIVEQPSYYIENEELRILSGKEGIELLQDETKSLIIYTKKYT